MNAQIASVLLITSISDLGQLLNFSTQSRPCLYDLETRKKKPAKEIWKPPIIAVSIMVEVHISATEVGLRFWVDPSFCHNGVEPAVDVN